MHIQDILVPQYQSYFAAIAKWNKEQSSEENSERVQK
jgi:hypothetical protein